ncbi:MAG: CPBP family intramembrane metalloprotease [Oscillospiraceae bacterium]|nr:CPBP family intramembrane metalloprotease [Oscillospiraceae bacterium]
MNEWNDTFRPVKKVFSRVGFALCAILLGATGMQLLWFVLSDLVLGEGNWFTGSALGRTLGNIVPMYLVAFPLGVLIMGKIPSRPPRSIKLRPRHFWEFLPICMFLMYCGSYLGISVSALLSGGTALNPVEEAVTEGGFLQTLIVVVAAPITEELVFRKAILDRTRCFGEKTAVLLSALTFGLMHQNLFQFFYAFSLGLVFSYVYLRTGRIGYTIALHGIVNFMGGVIAPWILSVMEGSVTSPTPSANAIVGVLLVMLYAFTLIGASIFGAARFIIRSKRLLWLPGDYQLSKGWGGKALFLNPGIITFIVLCLAAITVNLFL